MNSRPQRNLLLLIDGKKPDELLLASVTGTSAADLAFLRDLGLITSPDATARVPVANPPAIPSSRSSASGSANQSSGAPVAATTAAPALSLAQAPVMNGHTLPAMSAASASSPATVQMRTQLHPMPVEAPPPRTRAANTLPSPLPVTIDIPLDMQQAVPNIGHVTKTLTSLIASELGLRGFTLTLAVERASGIDALLDVADRVLQQIETRKGVAAADKARRALFG